MCLRLPDVTLRIRNSQPAKPMLRIPREGELWPENLPVRAGVSAMGFGGINTHVALEAADTFHRKNFTGSERQQLSSAQDCELFLFHAANLSELSVRLEEMLGYASQISYSEMTIWRRRLQHPYRTIFLSLLMACAPPA